MYYKSKLEFEIENDEIYHVEWIARQKQKLISQEEHKKIRQEERKQELLDRANPYEAEIEICDHLIAYMTRKKIEHGLMPAEDESMADL